MSSCDSFFDSTNAMSTLASLWVFDMKDKNGVSLHGISTIEEAISATHINNEYFIKNRNGKCKFLNVLQGRNHTQSEDW